MTDYNDFNDIPDSVDKQDQGYSDFKDIPDIQTGYNDFSDIPDEDNAHKLLKLSEAIARPVENIGQMALQQINGPVAPLLMQGAQKVAPEAAGVVNEILNRGMYAGNRMFADVFNGIYNAAKTKDSLLDGAIAGIAAVPPAVQQGQFNEIKEFIAPTEKRQFKDLLIEHAPDFVKAAPATTELLNGIGNVVLDPLTYFDMPFGEELHGMTVETRNFGKVQLNKLGVDRLASEIDNLKGVASEDLTAVGVDARQISAAQAVAEAIDAGEKGLYNQTFGDKYAKQIQAVRDMPVFRDLAPGFDTLNNYVKKTLYKDAEGVELVNRREALVDRQRQSAASIRDYIMGLAANKKINKKDLIETLYNIDGIQRKYIPESGKFVPEDPNLTHQLMKEPVPYEQMTSNPSTNYGPPGFENALEPTPGSFTSYEDTVRQKIQEYLNGKRLDKHTQAAAVEGAQRMQDMLRKSYNAGALEFDARRYFENAYKYVPQSLGDRLNMIMPWGKKWKVNTADGAIGFNSVDEAMKSGFQPDKTVFSLLQSRLLDKMDVINRQNFANDLVRDFGVDGIVSSRVAKQLKDVGYLYVPGDTKYQILKLAGSTMSKYVETYKKFATRLRLDFPIRMGYYSGLQTLLTLGTDTYKMFNPKNWLLSATALMDEHGYSLGDWAKSMTKANPLTLDKQGYESIKQSMRDNSIFQNMDFTGIGRNKTYLKNKIETIEGKNFGGRIINQFPEATRGKIRATVGALDYMSWGEHISNLFRGALALAGRDMGYTWKDSADLARTGLFDFEKGAAKSDVKLMNKVVMFYQHPKFGLDLVARSFIKHPGTVLNIKKMTESMFSALEKLQTGQPLSPDDRTAIPNHYLDHMGYFAGRMSKDVIKWRSWNAMNPLDAMGVFNFDANDDSKDPEVLFRNGMARSIVAQFLPYIRIPLETGVPWLLGKRPAIALTGQKIETMGNVGYATPEKFLADVASAAGSETLGLLGSNFIMNKTIGNLSLSDQQKEAVKDVLGWKYDSRGRAHISPWQMYIAMQMIPSLNKTLKIDNPDLTPTEKAMDLILGTNTSVINLRNQRYYNKRYESWQRQNKRDEESAMKTRARLKAMVRENPISDEEQLQRDIAAAAQQLNQNQQ